MLVLFLTLIVCFECYTDLCATTENNYQKKNFQIVGYTQSYEKKEKYVEKNFALSPNTPVALVIGVCSVYVYIVHHKDIPINILE